MAGRCKKRAVFPENAVLGMEMVEVPSGAGDPAGDEVRGAAIADCAVSLCYHTTVGRPQCFDVTAAGARLRSI